MVYSSGQIVEASDIASQIIEINAIFGTGTGDVGYGGNSVNTGVTDIPTISPGDEIQSFTTSPGSPDEWKHMRNALVDCAAHQGNALSVAVPPASLLDDGDIVTFFSGLTAANTSTNVSALVANRTDSAAVHTLTQKLTSVRTTAWSTMLRHEFTVDFGSSDAARHYFNTSGDLRISATRTGGAASPQNAAWTALINANSPYIFDGVEYFALTASYVIKQSVNSGGAYSSNNWTIRAKRDDAPGPNGGAGSIIRFQSDFIDGHVNGFFDSVDGTFTSSIQENRSTVVFPRPSPTFTTITALTAGS